MNPYNSSQRQPFLSLDMKFFLRKKAIEASGILMWLMALMVMLSVIYFDHNDASFNKITNQASTNILGNWGGYIGDLFLQYIGLASSAVIIILIIWGWQIISATSLKHFWIKLGLAFFFVLVACLFFSNLHPAKSWPDLLSCGLGGCVGWWLNTQLQSTGMNHSFLMMAICLATLATLFIYIADIPWATYRYFIRFFARLLKSTLKKIGIFLVWVWQKMTASRTPSTNAPKSAPNYPTFAGNADALMRKPTAILKKPLTATPVLANPPNRELPANQARPPIIPEVATIEKSLTEESIPKKPIKKRLFDRKPAPKEVVAEPIRPSFDLPPLELMALPASNEKIQKLNVEGLEKNARLLESILNDFGIQGEVVNVRPGPVVTLYELEPAPGTKTSRVIGLADDIARSMSAVSVRIAVVPGRSVIGIEMPNQKREMVSFRELLSDESYQKNTASLALALGKDIGGSPVVVDLAKMPHLLIAGTTGSGKSVAINTMILSLLYRLSPDQCKFIMVDPKMLELSVYDGIPHLLSPVVTDPKKAIVALKWTVREMETRYRAMSKLSVRNIAGYNERIATAKKNNEILMHRVQTGFDPATGKPIFEEEPFVLAPLPFIVVVVDEMADLMLVAGKDIEATIQRLAQMARAAGIHIIMATQRPSVDVITGTIKANFPTRISFHVTSRIDSRTILSEQGAEQLLGQGDMLYMGQGGKIIRVHGPFVSDQEVEKIVRFLKDQGEPDYIQEITEEENEASNQADGTENDDNGDDLYDQAVSIVLREKKASTSFIQRHLQIGYNRAARIIEKMEKEGIVGTANHVGKREVLGRPNQEDMP